MAMNGQCKTLIVFPGAGNPSQHSYARVYGLIERGALEFGYASVDSSIRWPGQQNIEIDKLPPLDFRSAFDTAKKHLEIYEHDARPYDILARSFGTYVALSIATSLRPTLLNRLILWGVPPFWRMWELYVRDLSTTREIGKSKGVRIGDELFSSLEPVESLITTAAYQVVVASGTEDRFSTPADVSYLQSLAVDGNVRFSQPVKGAPHEVTDDSPAALIEDYFRALFE